MEEHKVKIIDIDWATHDVRRIVTEKPQGYSFIPGQATEVAINKPGLQEERRPFTFTSLNDDENLEFTIKVYEPDGVTEEIGKLKIGDELLIHDVWGAIQYKGPGYFIAGGAGVTPFIAILRQLKKDGNVDGNKLLFSNKKAEDIIYEDELKDILGNNLILSLTREDNNNYLYGHFDKQFLKGHIDDYKKYFYICSTAEMTEKMVNMLKELGIDDDKIVMEE
ncbi:MAG: hypothetical protein K9I94_01110 [Bacteroidales bacterium]|nr:hypothetical protein [Bacteroidales bacterium]